MAAMGAAQSSCESRCVQDPTVSTSMGLEEMKELVASTPVSFGATSCWACVPIGGCFGWWLQHSNSCSRAS